MMNQRDKWIKNLLVAQAMVMDLPRRKFVRNLSCFVNDEMAEHGPNHCGSAACFGGWVAVHPFFQAQGVKQDKEDGAPRMRRAPYAQQVSNRLFGCDSLFEASFYRGGRSEKQEVLWRIKNRLDELLS